MSHTKAQTVERDCTEKCKSKRHGSELSSVISKRSISDNELCAYLNWKCCNCGQIVDSDGRTALHFAASCGRRRLVQWLIRIKGAQINSKDIESGYTPLHRSIFYGKISTAVILIQLGANLNSMDNDDLTPLEHALKDRQYHESYNNSTPCQVYVWGSNTNYTLGTGSQHSRQLPELLDAFYRIYPDVSIKQVCLHKFHFVLVSTSGSVFSCGHGQGGRLGLSTENTILAPQEIRFASVGVQSFICAEVSIGRDHSLFLSESGQVWSCGLNTHHVLGIKPPPPQVLMPRPLPDFKHSIQGICAGRFHSVAWGPTAIFTWGLHAGQLGHDRTPNKTCITPKLVTNFFTAETEIITVAASDGATVISTKRGDVYVLHEYQCRKIASRLLNIVKTVVVGGHLNSKLSSDILVEHGGNELKVLILTSTGNLLLWQESWPQLIRCIYNLNRSLFVKDVVLNCSEMLFVTSDGEAFRGEIRPKKKKTQDVIQSTQKSAFHEFLEKDDCQIVKVSKFPHIHRAVKIQSDLKGRNFAVLQVDPCFSLVTIPQATSSNLVNDLKSLFQDSDEMDSLHDAVFEVDGVIFPVHRYIISLKSEPLQSLIDAMSQDAVIRLNNVHSAIFQQLLLYIYTGTCDILTCGVCPAILKNLKSANKNMKNSDKNKELGIKELDDENMSAFEYYSTDSHKTHTRKVKHNKEVINNIMDPVRLLQEAAKRFGVKSLCKKLDHFIYVDGLIQKKAQKHSMKIDKLTFDRACGSKPDVIIKSKNGIEIPAHKCILAARLEYFNNIFAVRWNMNSIRNVITMPISHTILEQIIDFLYTDNCKLTEKYKDIDFICSLLIVADQLFVDRLKEICEVSLSALLNLRNVAQMLQFASVYNAPQLKHCIMEFICLNLSAVLESRVLDNIEWDVLDELSDFYCQWNCNLSKRVITPFSDAPSDEIVKSVSDLYPIFIKSDDLNVENDLKVISNKVNNNKKETASKKKVRVRRNSYSESINKNTNKSKEVSDSSDYVFNKINESNASIKENKGEKEDVVKNDNWVKIGADKQQKQQKIVQARLRAVAAAKEELQKSQPMVENFTKLSLKNSPRNCELNSPGTSPIFAFSPVSIPKSNDPLKSPTTYEIPIQKVMKISQKQRKKLALEAVSIEEQIDKINKKPTISFADMMKQEIKSEDMSTGQGSSPKSPWQKIDLSFPVVEEENKQNFADIIADEKKQKEHWTKMRTKPLIYTQMEDKAIEELLRFYNADTLSEECITVHRVDNVTYSAPLWVQTNKQLK